MYARVATFVGGNAEELRRVNEEAVNSGTLELPEGIRSAMVLQGDGHRLFVTMFDTREQIEAAEERFMKMGEEIPEEIRGRRTALDIYEVVWTREAQAV
jgi:hypothetical protein